MTRDKALIKEWIEYVQVQGVNLTKWEESFIESIAEQFELKQWISDKQEEILERLYTEKTP